MKRKTLLICITCFALLACCLIVWLLFGGKKKNVTPTPAVTVKEASEKTQQDVPSEETNATPLDLVDEPELSQGIELPEIDIIETVENSGAQAEPDDKQPGDKVVEPSEASVQDSQPENVQPSGSAQGNNGAGTAENGDIDLPEVP